jgi:hypothetical protein
MQRVRKATTNLIWVTFDTLCVYLEGLYKDAHSGLDYTILKS